MLGCPSVWVGNPRSGRDLEGHPDCPPAQMQAALFLKPFNTGNCSPLEDSGASPLSLDIWHSTGVMDWSIFSSTPPYSAGLLCSQRHVGQLIYCTDFLFAAFVTLASAWEMELECVPVCPSSGRLLLPVLKASIFLAICESIRTQLDSGILSSMSRTSRWRKDAIVNGADWIWSERHALQA